MTLDRERALTFTLVFVLLFVGSWLALSGSHRHLASLAVILILCVLLFAALRNAYRQRNPSNKN